MHTASEMLVDKSIEIYETVHFLSRELLSRLTRLAWLQKRQKRPQKAIYCWRPN